jgi:hypothetical protein
MGVRMRWWTLVTAVQLPSPRAVRRHHTHWLLIANPGLETVAGWSYSRTGGAMQVGQHLYDPVYSTTVFNTVAALYAT